MRAIPLVTLALCLLAAAPTYAAPLPAMDVAVDAAAAKGFAGEVGVSDPTATLYRRAVSAPGRPHRVGETWRWASVTKQVTATLVMQEVQAHRLALEDTLAARLPGFTGKSAARITLRMLLQHTSGLPNPDDSGTANPAAMPNFYLRTGPGVGGTADALGYCAGKPKGEPGAGFSYNNCDFIVLGAVLERATGKSYAALVQARIARPLHLTTLALAGDGPSPPMAPGLVDEKTPEPPFNLATFGAAGGLYGDPADLLAFDRALLTHKLLDEDASQQAWAGEPKLGYVALGVWAFPAKLNGCTGAVKLVERRGEIGGVEVRNLLAPQIGRALVVFADRSDLDFGEIWQGKGLSYDLASAAFCS